MSREYTHPSSLLALAEMDLSASRLLQEAAHRAVKYPWGYSIDFYVRGISKHAAAGAARLVWC